MRVYSLGDIMKTCLLFRKATLPLLLLAASAATGAERLTTPEWFARLADPAPGTVILMRHGITGGEPYDGWSEAELSARRNQRLLSADGMRQCRRIGELLRESELRFENVYSSPMVRAADTARIVFGREPEIWSPLSSADTAPVAGTDAVQERLKKIHEGAPVEVWVTHSPNVSDLAGISAAEGEMLLTQVIKTDDLYRLQVVARWRLYE